MPPQPDPAAVNRLAKVAARLGSGFAGEQAAAATLGTGILAGLGLSWADVVQRAFRAPVPVAPAPVMPPHMALAQAALRHHQWLTAWERQFLADISNRSRLTAKQGKVLHDLLDKIRRSSGA